MKTKDLIKKLQELDPSGEIEVVADGLPIYFAEKMPAYWDGDLPMLIQDKDLIGRCYSVIGFKYTDKGKKIMLRSMSLDDFLTDNPDGNVELDLSTEKKQKEYQKMVNKLRDEIK